MEKLKVKSISISLLILALFVFSAFALVGCGSVSLETLEENYDAMQTAVKQLKDEGIFSSDSGSVFGVETEYLVSYGTVVDGYISAGTDEYVELKTLYNATLVYANAYTDSQIEYIIASVSDEDLSSAAQTAISNLNDSIVAYTEALSKFVSERKSLITHFETSSSTADLSALLMFKGKYGALVEAAVEISNCTADVIDEIDIMGYLQNTTLTSDDIEILQKYTNAKLLHVFSDLLISEVANKVNWSETVSGADKETLTTLIKSYSAMFETFRDKLIKTTSGLSDGDCADAFATAYTALEEFCVEIENYETALTGFDISVFASSPYFNDLTAYVEDNEFALIYLDKLQQFVTYSLPNFIDYVVEILALS